MTQNNLGNAYGDRIRGERADNLEQAIAAYHNALQVYTRDAFPQDWANNLGTGHPGGAGRPKTTWAPAMPTQTIAWSRIRGERADNLEQAIAAYQSALQVYTRDAFPQAWAITQNNLGNAYGDRIRGERADNLEQAIAAYHNALQVYTREAFPEDWAMTQGLLVSALLETVSTYRRG
jgi:predicted LPLAT superfamily acyltransferase